MLYHVNVKGYHGRMVKKLGSARHNKNMESCRDMNIQYQSISVVAQWCMLQGHAKTSKHALMPEENAMKRQWDMEQCEAT